MEEIRIQLTPMTRAVISHYNAERDKAISDLEIYLNRPVGVGEHSNITNDVINIFERLEKSENMLKFMESIVHVPQQQEQPQVHDGAQQQAQNQAQVGSSAIGSSGEFGGNAEQSGK